MREHCFISAPEPVFYFGAMSPYSWFAAERIGSLLPSARWSGVCAGLIFKAHGRTSWGLTERREQGLADCDARAAEHGLGPIEWPDPWPTSDLLIARAMLFAESRGQLKDYALEAMRLCFLEGRDLGELQAVLDAGALVGLQAGELEQALASEDIKSALRARTEEALTAGVFGVPSVVIGEELYWGDDSLQRAGEAYDVHRAL
jgi:2-hydroxychromene-2-carboxylate isomerase